MWNLILVHLEMVLVLVQDRCMVCAKHRKGSEIIFDAPDGTQVTWVIWNLVSVRLETVLVSVQDRCTICAERTMCLEIISNAPNGTPR
jgi:uncharacterized membrane protein